MVTISNVFIREGREGKPFVALELTGDIEMVQSQESGRFYATARRCSISSTFTEEAAKQLIGTKYPGSIARVQRDPYEYKIPESGETIMLSHGYEFKPETSVSKAQPMKLVA